MTSTRYIGICPAANRDAANAAMVAAGYGPDVFSVPLIPHPGANDAAAKEWACDWNASDDEWVTIKAAVASLGVTWHDEGHLSERRKSNGGKGFVRLLAETGRQRKVTEP